MKHLLLLVCILHLLCACESTPTDQNKSTMANEQQPSISEQAETKSDEATSTTNLNPPSKAIKHYICYTNDVNPAMKIWISFAEDGKAVQVKYIGQKTAINLVFDKEEYQEGGAHPTTIQYYDEMYNGQKNGSYKLTHSGVWDYVAYIRGKDSKPFNFTIDHDADPYGSEPCF